MRRLAQLVRYGAVSIVATTTSLVVLGILVTTRALSAGWANVVAQFVILDRGLFADRARVRQDQPVPVVSR